MKEISLPVTWDVALTLGEAASSKGEEIDKARRNGGKVVWSAISLEQILESIITEFLYPNPSNAETAHKQSFFSNRIIKSSFFSFAEKSKLVIDIVDSESLLEKKDKKDLEDKLYDVMEYRNAFAHGGICMNYGRGCVLSYWKKHPQEKILDDTYWTTLEKCYNRAHELVGKVLAKLCSASHSHADTGE